MLTLWIRDYIKRYSFIVDTKFERAILYIYYEINGTSKYKRLPYRATKKQLTSCIEDIKKEINYKETKKKRDSIVLEQMRQKESVIIFTS